MLVTVAGVVYQRIGSANDARRFPPPGRLIDIGDCRLHLDLRGEGSPAVVFEAGIAATSLSWRLVQPEVAKITATASYDRAGLGWSEASRQPRSIGQAAEELHTLLRCAGVAEPRILVAHSYGAWVACSYRARYPAEVCGMVLVDPAAACDWTGSAAEQSIKRLRRGILLSRRGGRLARVGVVRLALSLLAAGRRRVPKLIARASSGSGAGFTERIVGEVRKLPPEVLPMIQAHWCNPKCFHGMACYLESLPESAAAAGREVAAADALRHVPVVLLSAEGASAEQRAEHERMARTLRGRMEIVPGSGHWMHLDRPDVVIRAIREIMAQADAACT